MTLDRLVLTSYLYVNCDHVFLFNHVSTFGLCDYSLEVDLSKELMAPPMPVKENVVEEKIQV